MGLEGDSARQRQQQVQRVRSKTSGTFQKVGKQKSRGRTIGILVGRGQTPDGIRSQRTLNIHEHECKHKHACTHAHTHTVFGLDSAAADWGPAQAFRAQRSD